MKLYDLPPSPNARRVRIFIAEKGQEKPIEPENKITGEHQSEDYLAKNPLGKMPLLELDDGTCIAESAAICRYLEEMNPTPPLMGRNPLEKALVEMWHRRMELEFLIPMITIFLHTGEMWKDRVTQIPQVAETGILNVKERMEWLDKELDGKEFITGEDYTVADIAAQCAFVMGKAALGLRIAEDQLNLSNWFTRVSSRPTARA